MSICERHKVLLYFTIILLLSGCATSRKARQQKIDQVVYTARSYTGTPYLWGGTGRSGMDCSGLLYVSFESAKVKLPRTSRDQSKVGKKISLYELKAGDMLFFSEKKLFRKITHAGMVTQVNGPRDVKFIHASSSLGVVETQLFTDYYLERFVRARRVIR